ncbi:MAG: hypothetical protein O3A18_06365 [Planctomycetota bacterium]|nr:hypothetical protein [Planctomycetota bacterium]
MSRERRDLVKHLAEGDCLVPLLEQIRCQESAELHLGSSVGGKDAPAVFDRGLSEPGACGRQECCNAGKPEHKNAAGDQHLEQGDATRSGGFDEGIRA